MIEIIVGSVPTPAGTFGAVLTPAGLARLTFPSEPLAWCEEWVRRHWPDARPATDRRRLDGLGEELCAYFEGSLHSFATPTDMQGTAFQRAVWDALVTIPYGQTRSYSDIATQIRRPTAVRAVGAANGANPVPILVPCHRVIGKSGKLVGYAGGTPLKERLLMIEGVM